MTTTIRIHSTDRPAMGFQISMAQMILVLLALVALAPRAAAILAIALFYCSNHQSSVEGSQPSTKPDEVPKGKASVLLEPENSSVLPQKSETTNEQLASPLFTKLPAELRNQIYYCLLKSKRDGKLKRADLLLTEKRSGFVYQKNTKPECNAPYPDIHAALLRTCRRIYHEALPLLYSGSSFYFWWPRQNITFKLDGITKTQELKDNGPDIPTFNLLPCPQGRLSMIRNLTFKLALGAASHTKEADHSRGHWQQFMYESINPEGVDYVSFPGLEKLCLNFEDWDLGKEDWVPVGPFIGKFRGKAGLEVLVIIGLKNEENIERFKSALVKDGEMVSLSWKPWAHEAGPAQ